MESESRYLFKKALNEAFALQFDEDIRRCDQNTSCSEAHLARMRQIIGVDSRPEKSLRLHKSRIWLALLLAAALLLAGCTAYAYRRNIYGFIEKVYDTFVRVTVYDTDAQIKTMKVHYTLTMIPEGFEMGSEQRSPSLDHTIWKNADGDYISFKQTIAVNTSVVVDSEPDGTQALIVGQKTVYHYKGTDDTFIWTDKAYLYVISTSVSLDDDTVEHMIESMKPVVTAGQ